MEEIKFKAYNKTTGECRYFEKSYLFHDQYGTFILEKEEDWIFHKWTGFKDKDGKEIYADSDILCATKYPDDTPCPYTITFRDGSYYPKYLSDPDTTMPVLAQRDIDLLHDKIVGNMYKDKVTGESIL